jgi:pyruvate-ferredoxin/flavodoxin oxidoreductase
MVDKPTSDAATTWLTVDANEAVANVAHRVTEVCVIYPITPSSPMAEICEDMSSQGKTNLWGVVPQVTEMQSEAGAAGACHGSLQAGALSATFTASQGLLLMIPNMYKIAGELTPFVMHVSARALAYHALSIFGDHSDVMACRQTGFAMLCSNSVQEAHDFAAISHAATLKARVPFLHYFDGFRTSHEVSKMARISDAQLRSLISDDLVAAHRARALTPDKPLLRGTAQNPDVYFQGREAQNPFYNATPDIVQDYMDEFAKATGRKYNLVDYVGHPEAERVIVAMGSGAATIEDTVEHLVAKGEKIGLIKVRLYRPFPAAAFVTAIPATAKSIAVLDRTKEAGAPAEPLHLDVSLALVESQFGAAPRFASLPKVIGGRYGLSSKEFTPTMVKAVYDELAKASPKPRFTVGINDDVTHLSLDYDDSFDIEPDDVTRCLFFGLGADGTVGANKNSIKIIAGEEGTFGQGYFVYDSKKSGAMTVSHLRFSPRPINAAYLITSANFVAVHLFTLLEKVEIVEKAKVGATLLLNAPYSAEEVWDHLPREAQEQIVKKKIKVFTINADEVAQATGMGRRVNTIMQTCFFAISGVLPRDKAIEKIKKAIEKTYGRKSRELVEKNFAAVDASLAHLHEVTVPDHVTANWGRPPAVPDYAPDFVKRVTAAIMAGHGDNLPVSAFAETVDGTWPTATTQYEKRNIALEIPVWDSSICIQCNKCALVCPHAAIRPKVVEPAALANAPETFKSVDYKAKDFPGAKFVLQVAPEDCTGCAVCVQVCPSKDKANPKHKSLDMAPQIPLRASEAKNWDFFLKLPEADRTKLQPNVKHSQLLRPLFEFSGACNGCGETPYVKLMSQLFGDRIMIGNATGCSSIYGGNLPTTPYTVDDAGRGPAWNNSLFEDNAEFGVGLRLGLNLHRDHALVKLKALASQVGDDLASALIAGTNLRDEDGVRAQRERVAALKAKLAGIKTPEAKMLSDLADYLVYKAVWILGGDGWAYDIGFGGLDHVFGMGIDVNVLVMDTEVYSNTGGQMSKATPIGASAKFAAAGRVTHKKDLGQIAMSYEHAYVASVAFGAKDAQTVTAFNEAYSYDGTSVIIAYSHCIAHGYDLKKGLSQQALAVDSGHWTLYRYDPRRAAAGQAPLQLDSAAPKKPLSEFMANETRFQIVARQNPARYEELVKHAEAFGHTRYDMLKHLSGFGEAPTEGSAE